VKLDPYKVLGLHKEATTEQVLAAHRRAVKATHPDAGGTADDFDAVQKSDVDGRSFEPKYRTWLFYCQKERQLRIIAPPICLLWAGCHAILRLIKPQFRCDTFDQTTVNLNRDSTTS
jgi:hypothetical protein